ncbi:hypothetical protein BDR07DRAFT_1376365 [Suillus spraguei]|nr:hypothetical protein BDR07DRAFT_1376365 [Suillus spraguei]
MVDKLLWQKCRAAGLNAWWASKRQRKSLDMSNQDKNACVQATDISSKAPDVAISSGPGASYYKVTCEEIADKDGLNLIANRHVHGKETELILGDINESLAECSRETDGGNHDDVISDGRLGDEGTDAESDCDDGNHRGDENIRDYSFKLRKSPSVEEARKALDDLKILLKPPQNDQTGYCDAKLPVILKERLNHMKSFLWLYVDVGSDGKAHSANSVGDLKLHLQSLGKFVRVQDLVDYLNVHENQTHFGMKKGISLKTAQRWMGQLGYQWKMEPIF